MLCINLQLRVFVRTLSSRLEKKDYPILLEYEIPESTHNTKGDISVHKKTSITTENHNELISLLREYYSHSSRGRSNKNKRDQTPTKKSALFLKRFSLFFFLFFFFF